MEHMEPKSMFSHFQNNKSCQTGDTYKNAFVWCYRWILVSKEQGLLKKNLL